MWHESSIFSGMVDLDAEEVVLQVFGGDSDMEVEMRGLRDETFREIGGQEGWRRNNDGRKRSQVGGTLISLYRLKTNAVYKTN